MSTVMGFRPEDAERFEVGPTIVFTGRRRWYVRLWRWITRHRGPVSTITAIDRENGTITVERWGPNA